MEPERNGPQQSGPDPASSRAGSSRMSRPEPAQTTVTGGNSGTGEQVRQAPSSGENRQSETRSRQSSSDSAAVKSKPLETSKPSSSGLLPAILAILAVVALGWLLLGRSSSDAPPSSGPAVTQPADMTAAETMNPNFQKHQRRAGVQPMQLSSLDIDQRATQAAIAAAKAGQAIPGLADATPDLRAAIERGEVTFYTVRAYDTCAEDGDWVTITTDNGARIGSMMLTIAGTSVTFPVVGNQAPNLTLIGDKDGVGGITAGVQTSSGTWYSGVLSPGQAEPIPAVMR